MVSRIFTSRCCKLYVRNQVPTGDIPTCPEKCQHTTKHQYISSGNLMRQSEYLTGSITVSWCLSATVYGTVGSSDAHQSPTSPLARQPSSRQGAVVPIPSFEAHYSIGSIYAFSAAAASLAAFRSRASPGLPFCGNFVSPCSP